MKIKCVGIVIVAFSSMLSTLNLAEASTLQVSAGDIAAINSKISAQRELAVRAAPVKSAATLASYMKLTPAKDNPINFLSPASQKVFLSSLTFNEKGLTGFNYAVLKDELSLRQIESVLGLFGSQDTAVMAKSGGNEDTVTCDDDIDDPLRGSANRDGVIAISSKQASTKVPTLKESLPGTNCVPPPPGGGGSGGGGSGGGGWGGGGPGSGGWIITLPPPVPMPPQDYLNMECFSRGTCGPRVAFICKNSC